MKTKDKELLENWEENLTSLPYEKHIGKDMYVNRELNITERVYLKMLINKLLSAKERQVMEEAIMGISVLLRIIESLEKSMNLDYNRFDVNILTDKNEIIKQIKQKYLN